MTDNYILQVLYLGMYSQEREAKLLSRLWPEELEIAKVLIGETKPDDAHEVIWKSFSDWAELNGLVKPTCGWLCVADTGNTYFYKHQPRPLSEDECEVVELKPRD